MIGPLTCVMACVVWLLSQSTVPVMLKRPSTKSLFVHGRHLQVGQLLGRDREIRRRRAAEPAAAGAAAAASGRRLLAVPPQPASDQRAATTAVRSACLMESPAFRPRS